MKTRKFEKNDFAKFRKIYENVKIMKIKIDSPKINYFTVLSL